MKNARALTFCMRPFARRPPTRPKGVWLKMQLPEPFSDMLNARELNAEERTVLCSDAPALAVELWFRDKARQKEQLILTRFVVKSSSGETHCGLSPPSVDPVVERKDSSVTGCRTGQCHHASYSPLAAALRCFAPGTRALTPCANVLILAGAGAGDFTGRLAGTSKPDADINKMLRAMAKPKKVTAPGPARGAPPSPAQNAVPDVGDPAAAAGVASAAVDAEEGDAAAALLAAATGAPDPPSLPQAAFPSEAGDAEEQAAGAGAGDGGAAAGAEEAHEEGGDIEAARKLLAAHAGGCYRAAGLSAGGDGVGGEEADAEADDEGEGEEAPPLPPPAASSSGAGEAPSGALQAAIEQTSGAPAAVPAAAFDTGVEGLVVPPGAEVFDSPLRLERRLLRGKKEKRRMVVSSRGAFSVFLLRLSADAFLFACWAQAGVEPFRTYLNGSLAQSALGLSGVLR